MADINLSSAGFRNFSGPFDSCKDPVGFGPCTVVDISTHLKESRFAAPFDIYPDDPEMRYERIINADLQVDESIYIYPVVDLYKKLTAAIAKVEQPVEGLVFELELYGVAEDCPQGTPPGAVDPAKIISLGEIDMNPDPQDACGDAIVLDKLPSEMEDFWTEYETMGLRLRVKSLPTNGWKPIDKCAPKSDCWGLQLRFEIYDPCFQDEVYTNSDCVACFKPRDYFNRPKLTHP